MCAHSMIKRGQVILETVLVIICLSVIAIASVRLFANLNTSMLNRLDIYRTSRKAALNDPSSLEGREIDVAPRSASVKRAISDPTAFLDYTGGVGTIIPEIPKADFNWLYGFLYEKDLIFDFILRYKFNQVLWFAQHLQWIQTTPTRGYFSPYNYIYTMKSLLKELHDKDTGYDPIFRNQEGLVKRAYEKMIEQVQAKYKTYDVVNGTRIHNASKALNLTRAIETLRNVTRGTNTFLNGTAANLGKTLSGYTPCCPRVYYRKPSEGHINATKALNYIVTGDASLFSDIDLGGQTPMNVMTDIFGAIPEGADVNAISPFLTRQASRRLYYTRSYLSRYPNKRNLERAMYWANDVQGYLTADDALISDVLSQLMDNLDKALAFRKKIDSKRYDTNDTRALEHYYNISQLQSWALYEVAEKIRY